MALLEDLKTEVAGIFPRATWLGWPDVLQAMRQFDGDDPLGHLAKVCGASSGQLIEMPDIREEFRFPGLTVDLRVS